MKPYLLALVLAVALPACGGAVINKGPAGLSPTCQMPRVEVVEEPGDPGDADTVFIYLPKGEYENYPARMIFVSSVARCVTRIIDLPPQTIPSWQVKMGDRITGVYAGPRPPPPPPIGEPKFAHLDLMVQASQLVQAIWEVPREPGKFQQLEVQP